MKKILLTLLLLLTGMLFTNKVSASPTIARLKGFNLVGNDWTLVSEVIPPETVSSTAKDGSLTTGRLDYWAAVYKNYVVSEDIMFIIVCIEGQMTPSANVFDHEFRNKSMILEIERKSGPIQFVARMNVPTTKIINKSASISIDSDSNFAFSITHSETFNELQTYITTQNTMHVRTAFEFKVYSTDTAANRSTMVFKEFMVYCIRNYSTYPLQQRAISIKATATSYFFRDGFWNNKTSNTSLYKDFIFTA